MIHCKRQIIEMRRHCSILRYRTSNPEIATVSGKGTIKAVASGSCTVYIQTVNGIWAAVEVTVE